MKYEELKPYLSGTDIKKAIDILVSQRDPVDVKVYKEQWDTETHDVVKTDKRPDRTVKSDEGDRVELVNRVPIPLQKNIVGKAVTFLFGNPVELISEPVGDQEEKVLAATSRILDDIKSHSQNRIIAKHLFKSTQVAEIWYPEPVAESHEDYGFPTKFRARMGVFSPWNGDELYPYFDPTGNMIAFSRSYVIKDDEGKEIKHFETYTAEFYRQWRDNQGTWEEVLNVPNIIGRIPVVFAEQDSVEWADVQRAISRLELLLSNHGDTNDYNGSPMIIATGNIQSFGSKGQSGKVIELEDGADMKYLSWDHAPESIKLEIENLFKVIHAYTQTPDISFESVKGISSISGIALRFLFMDAHLKVLDKREIFDPYLKRRLNIIKSFVGVFNTGLKQAASKLRIDAEVVPYTVDDIVERMTALTIANGGKPLVSQKSAARLSQLVNDPESDWDQMQDEASKEGVGDIFEPQE